MASKRMQKEIEDKALKTRNAREAAEAPGASDRDKADLKLMEQDLQAARQKSKRTDETKRNEGATSTSTSTGASKSPKAMERKLDAALEDSFPGSDPVSFVQAAPSEKGKSAPSPEDSKNRRDAG